MRLKVDPSDKQRIVLSDYVATTFARTTNGMFSDDKNQQHAEEIVAKWNAAERYVNALSEIARRTNDFAHGDDLLRAFVQGINQIAVDALAAADDRP